VAPLAAPAGDPDPRPGARLQARRLPRHLPRVPVRHDARARARLLQDLRGTEHRRAARLDRRVHETRPEALRRHRPADQRLLRGRLGRPARRARAAADEPDPRTLRERGLPLRALGDGARAAALEREVRLATDGRGQRQAQYYFWREVGRRMNIKDIPPTLAELDAFNREAEQTRFAPTEAGRRVARAQLDVFLGWFPWVPKRLGARAIAALVDERVVEVLALPRPTRHERRVAEAALRLRARVVRRLPTRRRPRLRTTMRRRTYPDDYRIEQLGPPPPAAATLTAEAP